MSGGAGVEMTVHGSGRGRKPKPGRITFVGSGPGDPGLLTTRARTVLANAALVFTDPDVPQAVLNVVGTALPPAVGPAPAPNVPSEGADQTAPPVVSVGPDIRPALGEPAEVAKTLVAEAKSGPRATNPARITAFNATPIPAPLPPIPAAAPIPRIPSGDWMESNPRKENRR